MLLIFSGIDQDGACAVILPQVCLATNAKVVIFHNVCVFIRALVKKPVLQWWNRMIFHMFKAEMCDRFLCEARKEWGRDVRDVLACVWNRNSESRHSVPMVEAF
jgi:hypothetical protein